MGDPSSNRFDCSLLLSLNAVGKRQEVIIDRLVQCREKMKQLTKICWHLIASRLLGCSRFKPCLGPGYFQLLS